MNKQYEERIGTSLILSIIVQPDRSKSLPFSVTLLLLAIVPVLCHIGKHTCHSSKTFTCHHAHTIVIHHNIFRYYDAR